MNQQVHRMIRLVTLRVMHVAHVAKSNFTQFLRSFQLDKFLFSAQVIKRFLSSDQQSYSILDRLPKQVESSHCTAQILTFYQTQNFFNRNFKIVLEHFSTHTHIVFH